MVNLEVQKEEKLKKYSFVGYSYYDTPDGQDLFPKLLYTSKVTLGVGLFVGTINAYSIRGSPVLFRDRCVKLFEVLGPALATSTTFTITTYVSTRLRAKDDSTNYIYGGMAAGVAAALAVNYPSIAPILMTIFGLIGHGKKTFKMQNMNLLSTSTTKGYSSYFLRKLDFTLVPERKGMWTKEPLPSN